MSKNTIVFEGGIDNIRTLADNSVRVSLGTPELTPETVGNMYGMLKQPGYVVISTMPISQKQLDAVEGATVDREFENKTPSQRMRNVLYVLWEQQQPKETSPEGTTTYVDFDLFYKRKMTELINFIKNKLS
jgi:hypothetical protein|tara:strand:+ start:292 stop:684 length:393 start_codon:yes stop_codon:yes gene_type:complete